MRVIIIRAGALGDTLMLMPSISHLRRSTGIIVIGRYPGIDYLRPYVDQCMDFERSGLHRLFMESPGKESDLRLPDADLVAAFLTDPEGVVSKNLRYLLPDAKIHLFLPLPLPGDKVHVALYMARCLESAGLPINAGQAIKEARERPLFSEMDLSVKRRRILIHPGSGSKKKNHSPDFWLELIRALKGVFQDRPEKIALLLGPAEEDLTSFFQEAPDLRDTEVISSPEKGDLISYLCGAGIYIGHDSGITHLAAMHGLPVIALFRESSISQWGPLGPHVRIIKDKNPRSDLIGDIVKEGIGLLTDTDLFSIA